VESMWRYAFLLLIIKGGGAFDSELSFVGVIYLVGIRSNRLDIWDFESD
jgi:hypothetical protein